MHTVLYSQRTIINQPKWTNKSPGLKNYVISIVLRTRLRPFSEKGSGISFLSVLFSRFEVWIFRFGVFHFRGLSAFFLNVETLLIGRNFLQIYHPAHSLASDCINKISSTFVEKVSPNLLKLSYQSLYIVTALTLVSFCGFRLLFHESIKSFSSRSQ